MTTELIEPADVFTMTRKWRVMSGPKTDVQEYRVPVLLTEVGMICDPKLARKLDDNPCDIDK